jgi:hypothetical protein
VNKNFVVLLASAVCGFSSALNADQIDDCIAKELSKVSEVVPFQTNEQGCETKGTGLDGVRHACDATVCYKAPPGRTIKGDVAVADFSKNGSEHSFSAVFYEFNSYGQVEKACVNVHARSPHGHGKGRGWQNVKLSGQIQTVPDQAAVIAITKACAKPT